MPHILLEPMGSGATRLSCSGNNAELVKMLSDAIAAHPGFAKIVMEATMLAIDYVKSCGEVMLTDLKENPVHPTEN